LQVKEGRIVLIVYERMQRNQYYAAGTLASAWCCSNAAAV